MNRVLKERKWLTRLCKWTLVTVCVMGSTLAIYLLCTLYHANFHTVVEGQVYRSGQMDADKLARTIERYCIKSIINLRGERPTKSWYQAEIGTCRKLNVVHYDTPLDSGHDLTLQQMNDLVVLLRQAPKPALIHCLGGADRSGLASAFYRLAITGDDPNKADDELCIWYGHVTLIRPKARAMDRSFWHYVSNHVSQSDLHFKPASGSP